MGTKSKHKLLSVEDYDMFFNNNNPPDDDSNEGGLSYPQLSQILNMHGFHQLHRSHRRKENLVKAASGINNPITPNRSTLLDTRVSANNARLSFDQLNADLDDLHWQDMSLQTFQSLSFHDDDDNDNNNDNDGSGSGSGSRCTTTTAQPRPKRRGRKPKERKVFDPVFVTKPRSKNNVQKRKSLAQITLALSAS